jgi:hypothetical protein
VKLNEFLQLQAAIEAEIGDWHGRLSEAQHNVQEAEQEIRRLEYELTELIATGTDEEVDQ